MAKKLFTVLGLLVVTSMLFVACGGDSETPATDVDQEPATEEPASEEPAAEPMEETPATPRIGAWLDTLSISIASADSAVDQIQAGAADIYGATLGKPSDFESIEEAGLDYFTSFGGYYDLSFNTYGPTFDGTGKLNPFSDPVCREAMHWLIDRYYIVEKVYGGAAVPKFVPMASAFTEYVRYVDLIRPYEVYYATNREKAESAFSACMTDLGAETFDGKWIFESVPVEIIFLIRPDGDGTRLQMGDIIANWLEEVGFTVDRQYVTSSEASPIWIGSDMADGMFHIYTGGLMLTGVQNDSSEDFQLLSSPSSSLGAYSIYQTYSREITAEDQQLFDDLANKAYTSLEERREMFKQAFDTFFKYNFRIFLVDLVSATPYSPELTVAGDLATGVDTNPLSPLTMRFKDRVGGDVRMIEPDLFTDPANPINGSSWVYDRVWQQPTQSFDVIPHPHTGIQLPVRLDHAEVTVQSDLPVGKTYNWVSLETAEEIIVPGEMWVDWDAEDQVFITADEKFPEGLTALTKVVYYYPDDLFDMTWHDGSRLSVGDFVMKMIMTFEQAKEASLIYDASVVPLYEASMEAFKGFKIISSDPLVIESYSDSWYGDAERIVGYQAPFWPNYGTGEAQWAMIAVSNITEADGRAAYSVTKSGTNEIEWLNYLGGPSLKILETALAEATIENLIPFASTMGEFVTADEAAIRYSNIQEWYDTYDHFWIGTGPFFISDLSLEEETITLTHNPNFPDLASRWDGFSIPKIAKVAIDGPDRVVIGEEATYNVSVQFQGEPYPSEEVVEVNYLLFDTQNQNIEVGQVEFVAEGQYKVTLSANTTAQLITGVNKLEVVVIVLPVATSSITSIEFLTE